MGRLLRWAVMTLIIALLLSMSSASAQSVAPGCGPTISKPGGQSWVCTFSDDFTGFRLDGSKWAVIQTATSGYRSGEECMVDSPNNIRVNNGKVRLTVRKERAPFVCKSPYGDFRTQYTGASIFTHSRFAQAYGRFEIRAKFPTTTVAGVHSALWLYPEVTKYGPWPASGEIDIAEFYSSYPDRVIPYVHYQQDAYDPTVTNNYCMVVNPAAYHNYLLEWTPEKMTIKFDGVTCMEHTINPAAPLTAPEPFDNPFNVVLTQALGITGNAFSTASTPLPATTEVDFVRAWS